MKTVFIIASFFVSAAAFSQVPLKDYTPRQFSQVQVSRLGIPGDTLAPPANLRDSVWLAGKDSILYMWSPALKRYVRATGSGGTGSSVWGGIAGGISSQTDLITKFNQYQPLVAQGPDSLYFKSDFSKGNFKTDVRSAGSNYFNPLITTPSQIPGLDAYIGQLFTSDGRIGYNPNTRKFYLDTTGLGGGGSTPTLQPQRLFGRYAGTSGAGQEIKLGSGLFLSGDSLYASGGSGSVTLPTKTIAARVSAGTGSYENVAIAEGLATIGTSLIAGQPYSNRILGLTGTGVDKTAALNSEALNSTRKTIQFDANEVTTINNTYNGQGKEHIFTNGGKFVGGGTAQNVFFGGNHNAAVVDTSIAVITPVNTILYAADFGLSETATAAYNTRVLQRISAAIQSNGGNTTLVFSKGNYLIGQQYFANGGGKGYAYYPYDYLKFTNCKNIIIEGNGATLKFADGLKIGAWNPATGVAYNGGGGFSDINYWSNIGTMVNLVNSQNVTVRNLNMHGNIQGSALGGPWGSGYETGGIGVQAVGNISGLVVSNCRINYFTTDAIGLIGYVYTANAPAMPVLIENCDLSGGGRQGISHDGGNGLTVTNCVMSNIGWTQNTATGIYVRSGPGSGIDIEPEADNNNVQVMCLNTALNHCTIKNNYGFSVLITNNSRSKGVTINDCDIENNYTGALWLDGENVTMNGGKVTGTYVQGYPYDGGSTLGYNEPKRNRLYNVYFSQKATDYVQARNTANSNTLQSVFENKYVLLDGCTFDLDSATISISGTEINNVTLKSVSASSSNVFGRFKGVNQFMVGTGGISFGDRAEQYGKIFANGTEIYAPVASFSKGLDFYNFGSSTARNKIRFVSGVYAWGTTYTAIPGDIEIHSDVDAGGDVAARYLGASVWETIWKVPGTGGGSSTNYWTLSGSDITKNNSGGVGINTTPASAALHVKSTSSYPYNIKLTDRGAEQTWAFGVDKDVVGDGTFGLYDITNSTAPFSVTASTGNITAASLAGTGTRMVVAGSNGQLSTQAIPSGSGSGTVTSFGFTNGGGFTGSVSNSTTTPILSLTLQNASTSQAGQLTAADWNTFNSKVSSPWVLSGNDLYYTAGGVGIGTVPTGATLHLQESSSHALGLKIANRNDNQQWSLSVDADAIDDGKFALINVTAGTIPITFLPGGNVGIGTTTPNTKLHVTGTIRSDVLAGTGNRLTAANSSGSIINTTIDPAKVLLHTDTVRGGLITTQFYVDSLTKKRVVNVTSLTDAGTYTIPTGTDIVFINISTGLDAQTIVLPASSINGKEVQIYFGGTIAAGASVFTNLTISAPSGETLYQVTAPTTATGGDCLHYTLNGVNKKWHRKKL